MNGELFDFKTRAAAYIQIAVIEFADGIIKDNRFITARFTGTISAGYYYIDLDELVSDYTRTVIMPSMFSRQIDFDGGVNTNADFYRISASPCCRMISNIRIEMVTDKYFTDYGCNIGTNWQIVEFNY
jgi:hypothetical protein